MEGLFQAKKLIDSAQNVFILTSENPGIDSLGVALSLSYILNNLGKNVNFFPEKIPKEYSFLSSPKTISEKFVISIKDKEISELYYEKENQTLNIFLSSKNGKIRKEDINLTAPLKQSPINHQETDLLITIGIENLEQLGDFYEKNFKLFYHAPILNIDNKLLNNKFGNINLIFEDLPIAVIFSKLTNGPNRKFDEKTKALLFAGIVEFFQKKKINQEALETIFELNKKNLDHQKITRFLNGGENSSQTKLLGIALRRIKPLGENKFPTIILTKEDFKNSASMPKDLSFVLEQLINKFFYFPSLLLLWESYSDETIKGFFHSSNRKTLKKILDCFEGKIKGKGILFSMKERSIVKAEKEMARII